jgi:hypothetical protein
VRVRGHVAGNDHALQRLFYEFLAGAHVVEYAAMEDEEAPVDAEACARHVG